MALAATVSGPGRLRRIGLAACSVIAALALPAVLVLGLLTAASAAARARAHRGRRLPPNRRGGHHWNGRRGRDGLLHALDRPDRNDADGRGRGRRRSDGSRRRLRLRRLLVL